MNLLNKQRLINVMLVVTGIISAVLIVEIGLRILKPPQLSITHAPCIYETDNRLGYRYIPQATGWLYRYFEIDNTVKINSLGFHDVEHNPAEIDEATRILVVGDSFTAALEVDTAQGWTQTLQQQLQQSGYPVEVINLGLDGTGTDVHLALLKEYLPIFQPDLVILAFYKNDIEDLKSKRYYRECYKDQVLVYYNQAQADELKAFVDDAQNQQPLFTWLFEKLYLVRLVAFIFDIDVFGQSNYHKPFGREMALDPANVDQLFAEFATLSQQHNFRLLVIPIPQKDKPTGSLDKLQNSVSASILARLEVIDIMPAVQNILERENRTYAKLFWQYDGHLNIYGNQTLGLAMSEVVDSRFEKSPITLHVPVEGIRLWTVVQWQDQQGNWHDVSDWSGELELNGTIRWWISADDYNKGPFRWVVSNEPDGPVLAVSPEFYLPDAKTPKWVEIQ
jgi:lysophospholipase L1-like esterase